MKILIAGSRGFIGRNCVRYFSASETVHACDILPADNEENYFCVGKEYSFEKILAENKYDLFINASGSAGVGFSLADPVADKKLNVTNVQEMLEALAKHQPECRFINLSSAAVYGNPESLPVPETAKTAPLSAYGFHKLEAEELLKKYHNEYGLRTASARIFSAYGPGLHKQIFWDIFNKAKKNKTVRLFGTGNESRDFIFIDDLVRALKTIAQNSSFSGEAVNVSSGIETTIREAAKEFLSQLGNNFVLEFSGETKPGDPLNWKADISVLQKMGFVPEVNFKNGLAKVAGEFIKITSP